MGYPPASGAVSVPRIRRVWLDDSASVASTPLVSNVADNEATVGQFNTTMTSHGAVAEVAAQAEASREVARQRVLRIPELGNNKDDLEPRVDYRELPRFRRASRGLGARLYLAWTRRPRSLLKASFAFAPTGQDVALPAAKLTELTNSMMILEDPIPVAQRRATTTLRTTPSTGTSRATRAAPRTLATRTSSFAAMTIVGEPHGSVQRQC